MKKLVCLLLTCLLLCSVFMLPAGAQEQQPDQAALLQAFKTYLDENDVEYKDWCLWNPLHNQTDGRFSLDILGLKCLCQCQRL